MGSARRGRRKSHPTGEAGPAELRPHEPERDLLGRRAKGAWTETGALATFNDRAGLPPLRHPGGRRLWHRAKGYKRLRTAPRGAGLAAAVITVVVLATAMLGGMAGLALTRMLPASFGVVRLLIDGVALVGGVIAGVIVAARVVMYATGALKWAARRVTGSGEPPAATTPKRTSPRRPLRVRRDFGGLAVLILTVFGPIVLAVTLTHGIKDERLVGRLRHHGVRVTGQVWDLVSVSGSPGYRGGYSVNHDIELQFVTNDNRLIRTPDPAIGGHRYSKGPLSDATIVYAPADPHVAAVAQQLRSPWHGGRRGNLITSSALTLVLIVYLPFWLRRRRRPA